ncbi:MAG: divalent-cation tolerance protein CutA [Burkholderiales bacterium]
MNPAAASEAIIVITTFPDRATAVQLARSLVAKRLAACVSVLAACESVYRWQETLESAAEVPLLIKTRAALYAAVETAVREAHPYELPEIVAVPVTRGLAGYLEWVAAETAASATDEPPAS